MPTEISVGGAAVGVVASVIEPEPLYTFDPGFETDTYYHSGNIQFLVPVRLKRDLEPGNYDIVADIFYQVCNARLCYPPMTKSDTVQITIEPGTPRSDRMSFTVATVTFDPRRSRHHPMRDNRKAKRCARARRYGPPESALPALRCGVSSQDLCVRIGSGLARWH